METWKCRWKYIWQTCNDDHVCLSNVWNLCLVVLLNHPWDRSISGIWKTSESPYYSHQHHQHQHHTRINTISITILLASPYYLNQHQHQHQHHTRIKMIISKIHTWYFKSKGLATGLGKKCFGKSLGEPERMFPHRPKVPLEDQDFYRSDFDASLELPQYLLQWSEELKPGQYCVVAACKNSQVQSSRVLYWLVVKT